MPFSLPFGRKRLPSSERLHANPPRYPEPAGPRADGERRHQDFLMAPPDSLLHLTHMLDNIERIRAWTDGLTMEAYRNRPMLRDAVERCLERISEASRRLPEETKASQPQIP